MINLVFSLEQVNQLLGILGTTPYNQSASFIHLIREQAIPQLPKEEPSEKQPVEEKNTEN